MNNSNLGQRNSPSARKLINLRERAFKEGGSSLELQIPIEYIRDISRDLNSNDITKDVARRNLLNWSEQLTNSTYWVPTSGTSGSIVSDNVIANPLNGEITASLITELTGNTLHYKQQSTPNIISGTPYTTSGYFKMNGRRYLGISIYDNSNHFGHFDLQAGTMAGLSSGVTGSITAVGDGWYRCAVTYTPNNVTSILSQFFLEIGFGTTVYSGDGVSGIYVYGVQTEQGSTATAYQQTQTYNTDTGASLIMTPNTIGESRLFNCKPELRNLIKYSEEFDNVIWSKTNSGTGTAPIVTANYSANPIDGAITADRVVYALNGGITSGDNSYLLTQIQTLIKNGNTYTVSFWLKTNDSSTITMRISDTANAQYTSLISVTPIWTRFNITFTVIIPTTNVITLSIHLRGNVTSQNADISIYGAQLEVGSTATTYQRTTDGIIDFQATRATTATVVQKDGTIGDGCYNLLQRSEESDNANWAKIATTISANTIANPINGQINADKLIENNTSATHFSYNNSGIINSGVTYTQSIYVKAGERRYVRWGTLTSLFGVNLILVDLLTGNVLNIYGTPNYTVTNIGNGWYRFTITATAIANGTASNYTEIQATAGTASYLGDGISGIYIWGAQLTKGSDIKPYLKTTNRQNVPSIDYSLGSNSPMLLIEPQRTNLLLQSSNFSTGSTWGTDTPPVTITTDVTISPAGDMTGDKTTENTGLSFQNLYQLRSGLSTGTPYTFSVYVKPAERRFTALQLQNSGSDIIRAIFDVSAGTISTPVSSAGAVTSPSASIVYANNGWYRCSLTGTFTTATTFGGNIHIRQNNSYGNYSGVSNNGLYIWGAQLEQGSNSTSYIATTTATVTRNSYTSYIDLFNNNLLNKDNFTLYAEGYLYNGINGGYLIALSSGTLGGTNAIGMHWGISPVYAISGSSSFALNNLSDNNNYKFIIQRNGTTVKFFRNGIQIWTTQTVPVFDYQYLLINSSSTYGVNKLLLWKYTLTDADCIDLTTL